MQAPLSQTESRKNMVKALMKFYDLHQGEAYRLLEDMLPSLLYEADGLRKLYYSPFDNSTAFILKTVQTLSQKLKIEEFSYVVDRLNDSVLKDPATRKEALDDFFAYINALKV